MIQTLQPKPRRKPKVAKIGPADHGRRMSLDEYDPVEVQAGYFYELAKGVIEVSDVPRPEHAFQVNETRNQLGVYHVAHPDRLSLVAGGSDAKLLIDADGSERHPDVLVYLEPPPDIRGSEVWRFWIPAIVIEIVSESSRVRDYEEKPDEYLAFGVREYWIVDPAERTMTVHQCRGGVWRTRVVRPTAKPYATPLLAGFTFDLRRVLAAGR